MNQRTEGEAPKALADYNFSELQSELAGVKTVVEDFLGRAKGLQDEISLRLAPAIKAAMDATEKTHGVITGPLPLSNTHTLKLDVGKSVKWDSAKLQAIAQTLPWARVEAIFKIDFSVSEAIYKGIKAVAPELAEKIEDARTVTYGTPKVSLVPVEDAV